MTDHLINDSSIGCTSCSKQISLDIVFSYATILAWISKYWIPLRNSFHWIWCSKEHNVLNANEYFFEKGEMQVANYLLFSRVSCFCLLNISNQCTYNICVLCFSFKSERFAINFSLFLKFRCLKKCAKNKGFYLQKTSLWSMTQIHLHFNHCPLVKDNMVMSI